MKATVMADVAKSRSRRPSNEPEESSPGTSPHSRGRHLDVERLRAGLDGNPGGTRRRSGSGGKHIFSNLFGLLSWQTKASQSASALADKDPGPGSAVAAASGDAQAGAALSMSSLLDFGDDDDSFRRRRRRRRSCLISPDDAWLSLWDSFTALTLLFIAGFTPYEVAFLPAPTGYSDGIFILGRVIDFIFLLDMSVQFLTMIPKPDEPDSYEEQHSVIANAYLRGWFPLDAVSIAASLFDFLPFWLAAGDTKLKSLTVLRVVRILRLIKLLRLLKASRVLKSWAVKIPTPRATVTILSSLAECMFVSHMIACLLGLTAELAGSPLDTWLATHGYCTPQTDEDTGALLLDEDDERLFECVPPEYRYLQCFWWAWGMLMGAPISLSAPWGPYTPYYSSGGYELLRIHEQLVVLVLKITTAFFWTSVIARFVQVYNNLDPDTRDFRMGWDALNRFVSYFKVSKQDALELRRYYIERADLARSKSRKLVMNNFSPHLAEKVRALRALRRRRTRARAARGMGDACMQDGATRARARVLSRLSPRRLERTRPLPYSLRSRSPNAPHCSPQTPSF